MDNNYTVEKRYQHDWLVKDEQGDTVAILHEQSPDDWRAWDWEYGTRLFIGEDFKYKSTTGQTALEVAQLIELM